MENNNNDQVLETQDWDRDSVPKPFQSFKNLETAAEGYRNAQQKITEQSESLKEFRPADESLFTKEGWDSNVKALDRFKGVDVPFEDTSVQALLHGAKEAKLSQSQLNNVLVAVYDKREEFSANMEAEFEKNLSPSDRARLSNIDKFKEGLSDNDKDIFNSLVQKPYINNAQIDLLDRILSDNRNVEIPKMKNNGIVSRMSEIDEQLKGLSMGRSADVNKYMELQTEKHRLASGK